ncbi:MAG: LysR substrate-binding domain-containing protein [Woeseiaceae bacterium]
MIPTGLREFVGVVENGGFTAAADALDVSTSFVSRQVRRLEDRLDTRLLHRTTRTVRLTDMGRIYYERSREILDNLAALESDMADLQERPKGRVRITAPGFYAQNYVAPALVEFMATYPEVSIEFDTRMRLVDIVAEGFDLAVRMNAPTDSSLVARKVAPRRMIVCGSPEYLDRHGRPKEPDDLRGHECLSLPDITWRFMYPDAIRTVRVRGAFTCDNGRALVEAAVHGLGIVRFAEYYLRDELANGALEPVLEEYEVEDAATWIVYADRHHLPTRVRYLIDFLVERLRALDRQDQPI